VYSIATPAPACGIGQIHPLNGLGRGIVDKADIYTIARKAHIGRHVTASTDMAMRILKAGLGLSTRSPGHA
jgi:hypothetical protein